METMATCQLISYLAIEAACVVSVIGLFLIQIFAQNDTLFPWGFIQYLILSRHNKVNPRYVRFYIDIINIHHFNHKIIF